MNDETPRKLNMRRWFNAVVIFLLLGLAFSFVSNLGKPKSAKIDENRQRIEILEKQVKALNEKVGIKESETTGQNK